ncbi:Hypothetical protein GL50581_223 [Giardia duodenalis ATCC 50581]|uniref:Uncharacterized protein n=1 Tax=Giardia intestinalis (strain ATCC 50581 / GS clone H7) TaxID=598745 RepID=C6LNC1_GIAIB|nr:Hypothetical protein GL50581_223 [Giardia intestinalis ATCC 50581]
MPPDRADARLSAWSRSPTLPRSQSTYPSRDPCLSRSSLRRPVALARISAHRRTFSLTVRLVQMLSRSWGQSETRPRRDRAVYGQRRSQPSPVHCPPEGASSPAMMPRAVDFPPPLVATRPTTSPCLRCRSSPRSASSLATLHLLSLRYVFSSPEADRRTALASMSLGRPVR